MTDDVVNVDFVGGPENRRLLGYKLPDQAPPPICESENRLEAGRYFWQPLVQLVARQHFLVY